MQSLKIYIFIPPVFLLLACSNQQTQNRSTKDSNKIDSGKSISQQDSTKYETIFDTLSKYELFKRLFDNPAFDTINNEVLWSPNYSERMNFTVSYDKKCHTGIDTIMYFSDGNTSKYVKYAVVLLGTYNYENKTERYGTHSEGAPIGIALFSQIYKGKWQLYDFQKFFTRLGLYEGADKGPQGRGTFSLLQIGDEWTCLSLEQENCSNGGYISHTIWLFSIEKFMLGGFPNTEMLSNILTYNPNDCNMGSDERVKHDLKTELRLIKKQKSYYDIDLITTGKGETGTEHYKFSEDYNRFVEEK